MVKTQFNTDIKILRTDNGSEFFSQDFISFLSTHGVIHQHSCVYTPQQNGVVKLKHRHLIEVARALRFHAFLPIKYWSACILTITSLLSDKSPYEVFVSTTTFLQTSQSIWVFMLCNQAFSSVEI